MFQVMRNSFRGWKLSSSLLASVLVGGCAAEDYPQTIFEPVTDLARDINALQSTIFWWTMLVLAVVIAALLVILLRFRERPGAPEPKRIHGNNTLEILWTLGPAIIVALILVPTVRTIFDTYSPGPEGALQVQAIGHQWWWEFRYPDLGIVTANQLHLPTDRPVQVTLSSGDVLHNFWIPRLAGKRYTYPQRRGAQAREHQNFNTLVFTVEEPGVYTGQCAEFCGEAHALMRMNVVVGAPEEFDAWVEAMRAPGIPGAPEPGAAVPDTGVTADPLVQEGYDLFRTRVCAACHTVEGVSQGRLGPALSRFGERWAVGAGVLDNTQENLELWIKDPQAVKPGAKMPGQRSEGGGMPAHGLTDEQVSAIAAYLLSLN